MTRQKAKATNRKKVEDNTPKSKDLRLLLKTTFQKELENLPSYLEELDPKDRINFLVKMMPFIMPKVESVHHELGEPQYNPFRLGGF